MFKATCDWGAISHIVGSHDLVIWNKRHTDQLFIGTEVHEQDKPIAERESIAFRDNIIALMNCSRRRVNDFYRAQNAENKAIQLFEAQRLGLLVPKTCMSNSPVEIREFIETYPPGRCLAKPFRSGSWKLDEQILVGYSAIVSLGDLPSERILQSCPMIFQEYIDKRFDVRVTCFGQQLCAVRLDSQRDHRSRVDWRTISPRHLNIEEIEIPADVSQACKALLNSLGLLFGCIDFAVSNDQEWYFLEINQMGQFLFIEQFFPRFRMLDMFVQLLTSDEVVQNDVYGLRFSDVAEEFFERVANEESIRAPKVNGSLIDERLLGH